PYTYGFLLAATVNHPDSVILPVGWFQPGREIEIRVDDQLPVKVRLETHLRRGYDFDQASFKVIGWRRHGPAAPVRRPAAPIARAPGRPETRRKRYCRCPARFRPPGGLDGE